MDQKEIETLVEELETRVDRLRALYDQYFMGIEKLEPQVPRKDVERRFYVLRREQIRNTALRFRFQNVLLRYNTYQTYWMRICRQIEEGTYKRDVRRANSRFAVNLDALGSRRTREQTAEGSVHDTQPPTQATEDFDDGLDVDVELDFELDDIPTLAPPPALEAAPLGGGAPEGGDATLTGALRTYRPPKELESLGQARALSAAQPPRAAPRPTTATSYAQKGAGGGRGKRPSENPVPPPVRAEGAVRRSTRPPSGRPSEPAGGRPRPLGSAEAKAAVRRASRPKIPKAAPVPAPTADLMPPRPVAKAPPKPGDLTDERVRQIYTKYVETKRAMSESTAAITFDGLAKSLRDSSDKLRQKHGGKTVDFEVAVKDGKTILRPVVK